MTQNIKDLICVLFLIRCLWNKIIIYSTFLTRVKTGLSVKTKGAPMNNLNRKGDSTVKNLMRRTIQLSVINNTKFLFVLGLKQSLTLVHNVLELTKEPKVTSNSP